LSAPPLETDLNHFFQFRPKPKPKPSFSAALFRNVSFILPKPLTVSAKTETLATPFYRNRKQTETAFSTGFGAETETETEFRSVSILAGPLCIRH